MITKPYDVWNTFLKDIRKRLEKNDIKNFLTWPSIRQSMHTEDKPHIPAIDYFEKNAKVFKDVEEIFEFGGGHGRICRMIYDRGFKGKYTIFDFPELIELQKFYLKSYTNVKYISDSDLLKDPCENSLFISMSAIEESPKDIQNIMFNFAKNFNSFLFKFSGGKGEFEDFMNSKKDCKWKYDDFVKNITYIMAGVKK